MHFFSFMSRSALAAGLMLFMLSDKSHSQPLTTLDYKITGQVMEVTPAVLSVPKGIPGSVGIAITGTIPAGSYVEAFLRGPSFPARRLVGAPNAPLMLPPLNLPGDYSLDSIRLASATGDTLLEGTPATVPVKVFDELLVSRVTSRPLTLDEIQERGIDIDESNFRAVEFEVAFVIEGQSFPVKFPVIAPNFKQTTEIIPAAELEARTLQAELLNQQIAQTVELPPELETVMPQIQVKGLNMQFVAKEEDADLALSIPPIPALMVIPGNIGFLNQFFSVQIFTENAAPNGSGLSVHSLTAQMVLPKGLDQTTGTHEVPGDDPLRFVRVNGVVQNLALVRAAGPDGKAGTEDDIDRLQPGQTGQGELLVEGLQEGLHVMELELKAKLDGLAAGTVDVTGKAAGSVLVRNPKFSMAFTHPRTVNFNEPYEAVVTIMNTSATVANLVSIELNGNNVSGGELLSADRVELGNIAPGETKSATFRIKAQRTGAITFSNLTTSDDSVIGRFRLKAGVDERGVALSPDSLTMPEFFNYLPQNVRHASQRVMGQALASNTAGQLPAGVLRVSKRLLSASFVKGENGKPRPVGGGSMPMALLEAAQRVRYGDPLSRVLPDLMLDWQGARDFDPGWDQIMRSTDAGREWREALMLAMENAVAGPDHAVTRLVDRGRDLAGRGEAWFMAASDRGGVALSFRSSDGKNITPNRSDLAKSGIFHGVGGEWLALTDANGVITWKTTDAASPALLSFMWIKADGTARELLWHLADFPAGACVSYDTASLTNELQIDLNGDGTVESTLAATETPFTELPPAVITVRQDPEVLVGRPPKPCKDSGISTTNESNQPIGIKNYANILAVLFSKPMTQDSVDFPAAFRLENGNEAAFVKMQEGGRVALLTMRQPVGGIIERHMTVGAEVKDARGNPVATESKLVLSRLLEGVNVNGRVIRADGSFAANVPVTLTYNDEIETGFGDCDPWIKRIAQVRTDASGFFAFDMVLGGIPYSLSATDTSSLSEAEIAVIMESAVNGEVQSEKLAELIATSEDSLLEIFAVSAMPEAIAKAEGLDRAIIHDEALPARYASESTYALRFRGRGTVTGRVVLADGTTPVAGAAANLFPDLNSRELGRGILTDSSGRFAFQGVPLGPFTIEAMTPTGLTRTVSGLLSATGQTVDMVISLGPTPPTYSDWQGQLLEPNGAPVSGGAVYVGKFDDEENSTGRFTIFGRATSNEGGFWSVTQVPLGKYSVIGLSLDGKRSGQRGPIVAAANITTTANVVIQARTVVQGVVQFANGDPVAGALVGGGDALATTDAFGRFTLTGVPTGPNRSISAGLLGDELNADPRKHLNRITQTSLNVQAGDNFAVLRFPSVGRIVGQVLDENGAPVPNEVVAIPFPGGDEPYFLWVETDAQGRYEAPGLSLNGPIGGAYDLSSPAPPVKESFDGAGMAALLKSAGSEEVAAIIGKAFEAFTGVNDPYLNGGGPFNPAGWGFVKSVKLDFDGETEVANIRYLRRSVISGTVKNGQGVPIGARVRLTGIGPSNTGQPSFIIRAEKNSDPALGTFTFNGDSFVGDWGLQAASPFFPVVLSTSGRTTSVDPNVTGIVMQFPAVQETNGSLTGQILAVGGLPAGPGVQVSISSGGDPRVLTTDANGRFTTGAALYSLPGNRGYRVTAFDPVTGAVAEGYAHVAASQDNQITLTLLGRGNIEIIVQRADGTPVAGAAVDVQGGQFPNDRVFGNTDVNGRYTASNVFEGPYSVTASATIGLTRSAGRAGFVVPRGGIGSATVSLSSTATVTGTFVTTNGVTPISFANVRLGTLAYSPTDANGRFTFNDVPLGSYALTAVDPVTGRGGNTTVSLSTNGEVRDVRIIETTLGTVSGLVINSFGNATVPNALVNLVADDPFALTRNFSVTSGPDGGYSIAGVAAGSFLIRADGRLATGLASGDSGVVRGTLPTGATSLQIDIPFNPRANLIATVFEADGVTPATNAAITLSGASSALRDTDAQGRVTFGNLPLGGYALSAISRTPGRTRDRTARVGVNLSDRGADTPVTLTLLGIGRVQGVVLLGDGTTTAPGSEAKVEVRAVDSLGAVVESVVVGSDGAFAFDNMPAGLPITLSAKFLGLAASETVTVTSGGTTTRNLILTASGTVEGRILRADGTTIATGTEVTITFPSRSGLQGAMLAVVGLDGRFSFSPIPQGGYSVQAIDADNNGINFRSGTITLNDEVDELGDIILDEAFPTVIATTPSHSTDGVDINSNITVVFSEPLKSSSVNNTGVFVRPAAGGAAVPASVTLTSSNVVTINPTAALQSSTAYQIVAVDGDLRNAVGVITNTGPRDLVDRQLNALFTASFVTRDQRPPAVLSFSPANNANQVDPTSPVRLTFDEPIQTGATITLTGPGGPVSGSTSLGVNNLVLAFVPTVPLLPNQVYTASVSGVRDLAGNFALNQPLSSTFFTLDTLGPVISQLRIKGGAAPASGATVLIEAVLASAEIGVRYRLSADAIVVGTSLLDSLEVPVTLPVEGEVTLRGIAIDRFGNEGPLTAFTVKVQPNQPPTITMSRINPPSGAVATNGSFSIRVSATDDAGVAELKAAIVGAATAALRTTPGTDIVISSTVLASATSGDLITIVTEAKDNSGLSTGEKTFTIPITDGTVPTLAFSGAAPTGAVNRGDVVTLPVRGQDNFGVSRYTLTTSGAFTASSEVTVDPTSKDDTRNLTLTVPNDAPQAGAGFTVTVRAFDAAGLGSTTIATTNLLMADLTPPQIASFSPVNNSTGITTRIAPTITFNEALDPATVTAGNFQLLLESDSSVIPSTVSINGAGTVATVTPAAPPLLPGTAYRVAVGTGIKDVAGNALAAASSTLFTTAPFTITAPLANAQVVEGQPLTVTVTEGFSFLSPREVRFFVNGTQEGVDPSPTFARGITVPAPTGLTDGILPLRADLHVTSSGAFMASASVNVIVRGINDDSDGDGLLNGQEIIAGTDPFRDDASEDPDDDDLTNAQEVALGTKANDSDTDDDFLNDGAEVAATTNPLDADTDDDLIVDGRESVFGTNPKLADTDGDTLSDGFEIGFGRISVVSGSFTWAEAKTDAETRGGHLLTLTSALENTALLLVNPTIGSTGSWIGYTDQNIEGQFRWVTDESGTFTNFASGQPDNASNEDFVHFFTTDAKWNDHNATHRTAYALETGFFTNPTLQDTDGDGIRDDVDTTVGQENRAPVALADSVNARRDTARTIPTATLLANDTDADSDPLAILSFTQPANGSLVLSGTNLIYTPVSAFSGSDAFNYTVTDPAGATSSATVSISVSPNRAPVAGTLLSSAGNTLNFDGVDDGVILPNNLINATTTLTTELWFKAGPQSVNGGVLFAYQAVAYPGGLTSNVPLLYIGADGKLRGEYWTGSVNPITTSGTVTNNQWHHVALVGQGTSQRMYLDGIQVGVLNQSIQIIGMPFNHFGVGRTQNWPSGGGTGYVHFQGEMDQVRVWHRALSAAEVSEIATGQEFQNRSSLAGEWGLNESSGTTALDGSPNLRHGTLVGAPARVSSTAPLQKPIQLTSVAEDGQIQIVPIAMDPDGDPITLRVATLPLRGQLFQALGDPVASGTLILSVPTVITDPALGLFYIPNANYSGSDSFTFVANDGELDSFPASVAVTVSPVPDAPTPLNDGPFTTQQFFAVTTGNVLANDSDPDGDTLTLLDFTQPASGTAVSNGNGTFTYTPEPSFSGTDSFTYRVTDGLHSSQPVTVTITVTAAVFVRWNNATGGQWTTASNWLPARVPTSADTAVIDLAGTYTITLSSGTQSPVAVIAGGSGIAVTLNHTGGTLSPFGASSVKAGSRYTLAGGVLTNAADFLVEGDFQWSSGTKNGAGILQIATGATASTSSGNQLSLHGGRILNRGTWTMGQTGAFASIQGAVFENRGLMVIAAGFYWDANDSGALGRLHNEAEGTICSTSGAWINAVLENRGRMEVNASGLTFDSGGSVEGTLALAATTVFVVKAATMTLSPATVIEGGGTLEISGGTLTCNGAMSLPKVNLVSGALAGTGDVTITGSLLWTGGNMAGSGRTIIPSNLIVTLTGTTNRQIENGRVLENRGEIIYNGDGLRFGDGASSKIVNTVGGTFEFRNAANLIRSNDIAHTFENAGLFRKTGTGTTVFWGSAVALVNTGTVRIESGGIHLDGGATLGGVMEIATGCTFTSSNQTCTVSAGFTITGAGLFSLDSGTLTTSHPLSIPNFRLNGGALAGTGDVTITESLLWTGGKMTGSGRTIISANKTATMTGTASRLIENGRVLENRGEFIYSGDGLRFGDGASSKIVNTASGTFEFRNAANLIRSNDIAHAFENAGLFRKTGTGSTVFWGSAVTLVNTGTVRVESGGIHLDGGATLGGVLDIATGCTFASSSQTCTVSAGLTITGAGLFSLESGTLTTSHPLSIPNFRMNGGTLTGTGEVTVTSVFTWNGGTMDGTGRTVIPDGGTANLAGSGAKMIQNGRVLENRSLVIYDGNGLSFNNGSGQILNASGATFELRNESDISRGNSSASYFFTNNGRLVRKGTGTSVFQNGSVQLMNNGLIDVESGTLQLNGSGTLGGLINLVAGTMLRVEIQLMNTAAGLVIAGDGQVELLNTLNVNNTLTIPKLILSGGSLNGTGEVTLSNSFTWNSGLMEGAGRTIIASGISPAILSGMGAKTIRNGRILENRGSLTYSGNGLGFNGTPGQIINSADGIFEIQGEADITRSDVVHNVFTNAGLLRKTQAGTTLLQDSSVFFSNNGIVQAESGTLQFSGGFNQPNALAEMRLLGGSLSGGTLTFAAGKITGVGTISATSVINSGATISPAPTDTRTITITGTYTQQAGGTLELDLDSDAVTGAFDKIIIGGAASFNGSVLLRNNLALNNEVFPLVTYASRSGSFASITTSIAGTATATYLANRADFTVTADAPAAPAPELAASYDEWATSMNALLNGAESASRLAGKGVGGASGASSAWDSNPMADPDHDGAVNLLEYAMQTHPLNASSIARLEIGTAAEQPDCIELHCRMRASASDIRYVIERTTDLVSWEEFTPSDADYLGSSEKAISTGVQLKTLRLDSNTAEGAIFRIKVMPIP
jgi:hypothetical protein